MDENLKRRVLEFVSFEAGVKLDDLTLDTTIVGDLAYKGGLGLEFMANFARVFNVDLSQFDTDKYLGSDDTCLLPRFLWSMTGLKRKTPEIVPMSIRNLVDAAEKGRWTSP
jgi:hypothetical protein